MSLPPPPEHFRGPVSAFVDAHVAPRFPRPIVLLAWTEALLAHHAEPHATCVIPGPPGECGAPVEGPDGLVVAHDGSAARWCTLRAMDETVRPSELHLVLQRGELPVLATPPPAEGHRWTWGEASTTRDGRALRSHGWQLCHLEAPSAELALRVRALRSLCPLNHFLWPRPDLHQPSLSGSEVVRAWVQDRLRAHLGTRGQLVWRRYLQAVGARVREPERDPVIEVGRPGP